MEFPDNHYVPLNLYTNFTKAAESNPDVKIYSDSLLPGFPEFGKETTYVEAVESIRKRAFQLIELGVVKGDKVVIFKTSRFDTYLLAVAVSYVGAIPVMVSHHLDAHIISVLSDRLEMPWLIFDEATASVALAEVVSSRVKLIELSRLVEKALKANQNYPQDFLDVDDISYITHTSGTTGIPKLIAHSANSMGWRTKWQKNVFDLIEKKKLMAFHISPVHSRFNIGISSAMAKGFPLLNISDTSEVSVERTLEKFQPYALETHPNNFVRWSSLAKMKPSIFASVKYYHSTFDAINKGTMARFLEASSDKRPVFMQVYGQSECGPMIYKFHTRDSIVALDSRDMGVGMPGLTEVRIVNEAGKEVATGESGNIQMLSKGRALTYYKENQRFADNVYDKWWDSGDYGQKNDAGNLLLFDRQIDLIESIESNLAIEDMLLDRLPFLDEVIIVRDAQGKPQPIVSIVAGETPNWDLWWELVSHMPFLNKPMIMSYDDIPRTATMKVQRLVLEGRFKEGKL
ncbi:acyl-CoA synthetase [Vagococcus intermedius]|uniref:Acyl-CoA synthetase n=1 Tax=Vagococcus intermedius TaxID=2991418 RepID=A0AAF0I715_9ENTE|nr:acyl-CoA synthetase [Vagococcus intermedius]WEG73035.1 acyl-CoA synthetase [Vagococcus intermedius]WEG75120.1 acyl-CoA synthetase [Vagococcus intermedius]